MSKTADIKLGVSLYSYQDNYYFHKHDLEGCLAAAAGSGATGVELFADSMVPEWPYISDRFADWWFGAMERYGLEPVCLDHFSDRAMWHSKQLSDEQMYERGVLYLKAAQKLGFRSIRVLHDAHIGIKISPYDLTTPVIVERLLPVARDCNVMMALECHAPTSVNDPQHEAYLEPAERLGLPYVGLQPDFSSYEYCMSTADIVWAVHQGCTREVLEQLRERQREAYFEGRPFDYEAVRHQFEGLPLTDADREFLDPKQHAFRGVPKFGGHIAPYKELEDYASKLVYCHGKFYDIDASGQVDNIDYPRVFQALKKGGYQGYICSEFEGNRRMNVAGWVDEIEYVRKHQELMRACLAG